MPSPIEVTDPTERCPWCNSPITRTTLLEIERRIRAEEQKKAEALTAGLHEKFRRDLADVRRAAAKEAQLRQQVIADVERRQLVELAKQREMLEREHQRAILKLRAAFTREKDATKKKVADLERELQKKTAHELGDGAELDLFETLRDAFPGDHITRVQRGEAGADIHHEVFHHGQSCGLIVIDSKNRKAWQNVFVTKLRRDQLDADAYHAILATTVFPSGEKELCVRDGVVLVSPARTTFVVQLLRASMVRLHMQGLSMKERSAKMGRVYAYITSEACARRFSEATKITSDLMALDVQENRDHQKVWAKRGRMTARLKSVLCELDTDISAIVEGAGYEAE